MRSSKKRSRSSQNRPRSLGNIVNRVFDSSGPEGKVRGTPQQIIEKYQGLARDAQLSNDRVAAENFLQHAEHYTRMLAEAQRELAAEQEARQQHYQQNGGHNGNGHQGQHNGQNGGREPQRERGERFERHGNGEGSRERGEYRGDRGEYRDNRGAHRDGGREASRDGSGPQPDLIDIRAASPSDVIDFGAENSGLIVDLPERELAQPAHDVQAQEPQPVIVESLANPQAEAAPAAEAEPAAEGQAARPTLRAPRGERAPRAPRRSEDAADAEASPRAPREPREPREPRAPKGEGAAPRRQPRPRKAAVAEQASGDAAE